MRVSYGQVYLLKNNSSHLFEKFKIQIKYYFKIQNIFVLISSLIISLIIFSGSLSNKLYEKMMARSTNDYLLIQWANTVLNNDDKVFSYNRSTALYKMEAYYQNLTWFIDFNDNRSTQYIDFIKSKKIDKIVFGDKKLQLGIFKNCTGDLIAFKKNIGRKVGRNPFNKGEQYNGWILNLIIKICQNVYLDNFKGSLFIKLSSYFLIYGA